MCVYIYIYTHIHAHTCIYTYVYIHIYIYIYVHTHNTNNIYYISISKALFYYFYCRYMHMRFMRCQFFTTRRVDNNVNIAWCIPMMIIAACWVVWAFRMGLLPDHIAFNAKVLARPAIPPDICHSRGPSRTGTRVSEVSRARSCAASSHSCCGMAQVLQRFAETPTSCKHCKATSTSWLAKFPTRVTLRKRPTRGATCNLRSTLAHMIMLPQQVSVLHSFARITCFAHVSVHSRVYPRTGPYMYVQSCASGYAEVGKPWSDFSLRGCRSTIYVQVERQPVAPNLPTNIAPYEYCLTQTFQEIPYVSENSTP